MLSEAGQRGIDMRVRPEILLNALIALVVGANFLVLFLIYDDRTSGSAESVDTPTALATTTVAPPTTEGSVAPETTPDAQSGSVVAVTASIDARESLRSALVGVQVQFLQSGVMPQTAFELKGSVPGLRLVDGVDRSDQSTIGVVTTETTALLVTQAEDGQWYCVASDGAGRVTYYDHGTTLDEVGSFSACNASTDGWS